MIRFSLLIMSLPYPLSAAWIAAAPEDSDVRGSTAIAKAI
jgi:hypothetical protein